MKRLAFLLVSCLMCVGLWAEETTDYIEIRVRESLVLQPGGDAAYVDVWLVGSRLYSGYNMDIHLPEGLSVDYKNNKPRVTRMGIYPYEEDEETGDKTYSHQLSYTYGVVGDRVLRVACASLENETLTATSGQLFRVYLKADAYAKPGAAEITIDGVALKVAGGAEYDPASRVDTHVAVGTNATTTLSVSGTNHWSTCILPFDAALPSGVRAFECSDNDGDKLILAEAESMAAYTPYILYSETGYTGSISGTVDGSQYPDGGVVVKGYLSGTVVKKSVTSGYVLQNQGEGAKFYLIKEGDEFVVPAGKCWMNPLSSSVRAFGFDFDSSTRLKATENDKVQSDIYTLQGTRVKELEAGKLYVKDGKVIMIK